MNLSDGQIFNLLEIELRLKQKQIQLKDQLRLLEESDPVLLSNIIEVSESGVESMEADVHIRTLAVKETISKQMTKINLALDKIKTGTYGICSKCGSQIDKERLELLPVASTCMLCL